MQEGWIAVVSMCEIFRMLTFIYTELVQLLILFLDCNTITDTAKWSSAVPA